MSSEMYPQFANLQLEYPRPTLILLPGGSRVEPDVSERVVGRYERFAKPLIDRLAAVALCTALAPVMLAVGIAVAVKLGSPVLLRQPRVGKGGREFRVYKFRTMTPDRRTGADAVGEWGGEDRRVRHKSADDPRLVPLGRFLRSWSLDELPQLFNVVRGEMSLVGPRPEMVAIVGRYEDWQHQRHLVKPGMTGLWQISERGNGLMHERTDVDLEYVQRVSLRQDLKILLFTIPAALGMHKGY